MSAPFAATSSMTDASNLNNAHSDVPFFANDALPPLEQLTQRLQRVLHGRPRQLHWGEPLLMSRCLLAVSERFANSQVMAREQRIARSVQALRLLGQKIDYVRLKYVCCGLVQAPDWGGRRLIDDTRLIEKILTTVLQWQHDARRFRICCDGLRQSLAAASHRKFPHSVASRDSVARIASFLETYAPATDPAQGKKR